MSSMEDFLKDLDEQAKDVLGGERVMSREDVAHALRLNREIINAVKEALETNELDVLEIGTRNNYLAGVELGLMISLGFGPVICHAYTIHALMELYEESKGGE